MSTISTNSFSSGGRLLQQVDRNGDKVSRALGRLSTGKRINRVSDDPAGFVAAEGLRGDLVELRAEHKVANASKFRVRQRESALGQVQNVLNDVRGNLVTAADGLNSDAQKYALQLEIDASLDAIDQIASTVEGVANSADLSALRQGGSATSLMAMQRRRRNSSIKNCKASAALAQQLVPTSARNTRLTGFAKIKS